MASAVTASTSNSHPQFLEFDEELFASVARDFARTLSVVLNGLEQGLTRLQ